MTAQLARVLSATAHHFRDATLSLDAAKASLAEVHSAVIQFDDLQLRQASEAPPAEGQAVSSAATSAWLQQLQSFLIGLTAELQRPGAPHPLSPPARAHAVATFDSLHAALTTQVSQSVPVCGAAEPQVSAAASGGSCRRGRRLVGTAVYSYTRYWSKCTAI